MKSLNPDVIQALTPMFIATIGGMIAIAALVSPNVPEGKSSVALGLA